MTLRYLWDGHTATTRGRPKANLVITDDERTQLTSFARSRSLPASLSARARIILSSAVGEADSSIAESLELSQATVGKCRARFIERRVAGLYDDVRPGPPRSTNDICMPSSSTRLEAGGDFLHSGVP